MTGKSNAQPNCTFNSVRLRFIFFSEGNQMTTINETLAAIAKLNRHAREIELALRHHIPAEHDPARRGMLQRAHRVLHDFVLASAPK